MSSRFPTRHPLLVGAAALAMFAACDADRASVLEPYGNVARNFPMEPVSTADASLPGGSIVVSRAAATAGGMSTLRVTLRHLEPLTGGVYKVWLAEETLATATAAATVTNWVPAVGTLRVITAGEGTSRDTVLTNRVSSFNGVADTTARYQLTVTDTSNTTDPLTAARNVVVVTIETSDAVTTPAATSPKPLWARFTNPTAGAAATTVNMSFGNYDPDQTKQFVFAPTGHGQTFIRDNFLVMSDTNLARPPRGYYYVAYLFGQDEEGAPTDTVELGSLNAPWPNGDVSLEDADESMVDGVVTDRPYAISAASLQYVGAATMRYAGYPFLVLALKNKLGADGVAPPNTVLLGALPENVVIPEEED